MDRVARLALWIGAALAALWVISANADEVAAAVGRGTLETIATLAGADPELVRNASTPALRATVASYLREWGRAGTSWGSLIGVLVVLARALPWLRTVAAGSLGAAAGSGLLTLAAAYAVLRAFGGDALLRDLLRGGGSSPFPVDRTENGDGACGPDEVYWPEHGMCVGIAVGTGTGAGTWS